MMSPWQIDRDRVESCLLDKLIETGLSDVSMTN